MSQAESEKTTLEKLRALVGIVKTTTLPEEELITEILLGLIWSAVMEARLEGEIMPQYARRQLEQARLQTSFNIDALSKFIFDQIPTRSEYVS